MIGSPKYKRGQIVTISFQDQTLAGKIQIIDAYGTFEQNTEVSYDIFVESENCLYKHIRESNIKPL